MQLRIDWELEILKHTPQNILVWFSCSLWFEVSKQNLPIVRSFIRLFDPQAQKGGSGRVE